MKSNYGLSFLILLIASDLNNLSKMSNIGIVGYGVVGSAVKHGFEKKGNKVRYFDKYKISSRLDEVINKSEYIFLCLPTPYKKGKIDLSIIDENIEKISRLESENKTIIIKSTVIPGTTENYSKKYPKNDFCFNPEFLQETNYIMDFLNADRTIIGADNKRIMGKVKKLYLDNFPEIPIMSMNSKSAEMTKYMANTLLATKVIFANEIYGLCEDMEIDYKTVKNAVIADKRIGDTHLDITDEKGFGGKCFPKDLIALLGLYSERKIDSTLLNAVWSKNLKIRKEKDWEEIPFVKSS